MVAENVFPYMRAFDDPPKGNPNDIPDHLWLAYCRIEIDRKERRYCIADYSPGPLAWPAFQLTRKYYLANFGPWRWASRFTRISTITAAGFTST